MSTLFEITEDLQRMAATIIALEEAEVDGVEGMDAEEYEALKKSLDDEMDAMADALDEKVDGYVWVLKDMEAKAAVYKAQKDAFYHKQQVQERAYKRLKARLGWALEELGVTEVGGELWKVRLQQSNPTVHVTDENAAVGAGFGEMVTTPKVDKKGLLNVWKLDPSLVEGFAEVTTGTHVRIS